MGHSAAGERYRKKKERRGKGTEGMGEKNTSRNKFLVAALFSLASKVRLAKRTYAKIICNCGKIQDKSFLLTR